MTRYDMRYEWIYWEEMKGEMKEGRKEEKKDMALHCIMEAYYSLDGGLVVDGASDGLNA